MEKSEKIFWPTQYMLVGVCIYVYIYIYIYNIYGKTFIRSSVIKYFKEEKLQVTIKSGNSDNVFKIESS